MAMACPPVYTIISFYLRILLSVCGIVVLVTAALTLNSRRHFFYIGTHIVADVPLKQLHEGRYAIFAGAFTFLSAGILNITLSFFSESLAMVIITVIDFLTVWFTLGSGIGTERLMKYFANRTLISVCCGFSFLAMAFAATLLALDTIELLVLQNRGRGLTGSSREHLTFATLISNPFGPHSMLAYANIQSVNPDTTSLEHTESAAKPVATEPNGYADTTTPTGIPNEAQYEPKPAV